MEGRFFGVLLLACLAAAWLACPARAAEPADSREIVVGTFEDPPFAMKDAGGDWHGVAIGLWREIARREHLPFRFEEYELEPLLEALEARRVDVAVGPLLITAHREQRFDMTSPYMHVALAIATRPASWRGQLLNLPGALIGRLLKATIGLAAAMVLVALIVWWLERHRNPEHFGGGAVKGVGDAVWWSASTMTTVGYGDRTPITFLGRAVGVVWMLVSIVLVSTFIASVTSELTVNQLQSQVRTFNDLAGLRVGVVEGSGAGEYLTAIGIASRDYATVETGVRHVVSGELDAFVDEWPVLRYVERETFAGEISVVVQPFDRGFVAFALPLESPRRRRINVALLDVIDEPAWQEIVRRYLGG